MHDVDHHHGHGRHEHGGEQVTGLEKLRKMTEHWIGHNEDHAASYRLWANRAREAGQEESGAILDEVASDAAEQNTKLRRVLHLLDSAGSAD
ncbi:MAG: hypothetical protein WAW37_02500 [Syntrophobacteraceae bacterium]